MNRQLLTLAAAICAATTLAQADLNRTVAIVNGEEIKGPEYYRRMEFLPNVGKMVGNSFATAPPGFMTLDQLINERLILQLAKEKGVFPTDAEVQAELKMVIERNPKFMEAYVASGGTQADLDYQMRLSLAQVKLQTRGVVVTDGEIDQHYKDNPSLFTIPKTVELRVITVENDANKAAVEADLKAGKAFEEVARARSVDISKANGGLISARPLEALDADSRAAVEKIKVGQVTDWIPTRGLLTKILFVKANPQKLLPLDAMMRANVRRTLMIDRGRTRPENDLAKMVANMRAKAKIDIKNKEFADTFNRMMGATKAGG